MDCHALKCAVVPLSNTSKLSEYYEYCFYALQEQTLQRMSNVLVWLDVDGWKCSISQGSLGNLLLMQFIDIN